MKKCVDKHEKTNYYGYNRIKNKCNEGIMLHLKVSESRRMLRAGTEE